MNQSACVERLGRIISINWFGCHYFDFRSYRFRCHRRAAKQPATADWTNHDIEIGNILEHFYRRCALSRHDVFVFERVNQDRACFCDHLCAGRFPRRLRRFTKNNLRAVTLHRAHFHPGRVRRHHNVGWNAAKFGRARDGTTMIA